jgi:hypothetical protein
MRTTRIAGTAMSADFLLAGYSSGIPFFETSAKSGENVIAAFAALVSLVKHQMFPQAVSIPAHADSAEMLEPGAPRNEPHAAVSSVHLLSSLESMQQERDEGRKRAAEMEAELARLRTLQLSVSSASAVAPYSPPPASDPSACPFLLPELLANPSKRIVEDEQGEEICKQCKKPIGAHRDKR